MSDEARGLFVRIPAMALRIILENRAEYHATRAAAYERALAELGGTADDDDTPLSGTNVRRSAGLKESAESHKRAEVKFAFLAAHLVDEPYDFTLRQLYDIEAIEA